MPIVSIDADWLSRLLGRDVPPAELEDALDQIGCDVEETAEIERFLCPVCETVIEGNLGAEKTKLCSVCGHKSEEPFESIGSGTVIRLDLLAARPDLFDVGGIARALKGYLGVESGLPAYTIEDSGLRVVVDPSVKEESSYRPHISCAVVSMPPLDDDLLVDIMQLQESLHWGVGRDRKLASIGVYDLTTVEGPIHYRTLHPDDEPFVPLGMPGQPMSGRKILEEHPKGTRYAKLLGEHARYPLLVDSRGQVLSMPPIINSEETKVKKGSTELFIDVTGISEAAVVRTLDTLIGSLVELGGKVRSVVIEDDGERVTPRVAPREITLERAEAIRWLGIPFTAEELEQSLLRMRVGVERQDEAGDRFTVRYPAFRTDIKHMVDVLEDVAIGYGYKRIAAAAVPSNTIGQPRPEEVKSGLVRQVLLGLGFSEIMTLPMTSEDEHYRSLRREVPEHYVRVKNPKLKELKVVREHLLSGLLKALRENRRRPLPLRLFEMDNVARLDAGALNGVGEERQLAIVEMGDDTGYASVRGQLDAILRELGATPTYEAADDPTFVTGRCARFTSPEGFEGLLGEIHPEVLVGTDPDSNPGYGLEHPVSAAIVRLHTIV